MTTIPRLLICDMQPNQLIHGVFALQNCQLGKTRNGKPFLKCLLGDRSMRVAGRMWNANDELYANLPTDGFVWIEGQTQPYQGEMQIIIQQIKAIEPSDEDLLQLLPSTRFDIEEMFGELTRILEWVQDENLKRLRDAYLNDAELMGKFKQAPAAMNLHHAFLGGLLEHTLQLLKLAEVVCPLYPQINQDIVLMGLFLHDLGKCGELRWSTGFGYSDDGQLVGHIARGAIWLEKKCDELAAAGTPVPEPVARVLQHIILSHHGRPEYGALKLPATPEAILVSLLDNLDAKTQMSLEATRLGPQKSPGQLGGNFTEKIWALETRLFRPDPTELADEEA